MKSSTINKCRVLYMHHLTADDDFLCEATRLDNCGGWMQAERAFRLCRSLRVALRETETNSAQDRRMGAVSLRRDSGW
jgi:hypothetical protein